MTLAAAYGLFLNRPQPALASFTIAYLGGSAVAGSSLLTCFNRAAGTVTASVLALLVAQLVVAKDWESTQIKILRGAIVILFQLPACYVRTMPLYGYAGTVACFTIAILLLSPDFTSNIAVARIVDTFVGVVIYLAVELMLNAQYAGDLIIDDLLGVCSHTGIRFTQFLIEFDILCKISGTDAGSSKSSKQRNSLFESYSQLSFRIKVFIAVNPILIVVMKICFAGCIKED
jgi:uncharacterized membrane protein YccC